MTQWFCYCCCYFCLFVVVVFEIESHDVAPVDLGTYHIDQAGFDLQ